MNTNIEIDADKIKETCHSFFNTTEKIGNSYYVLKKQIGDNPVLEHIFKLLGKCEEHFNEVIEQLGLKYRK